MSELIQTPPRWSVVPIHGKGKDHAGKKIDLIRHHELQFDRQCHARAVSGRQLEHLHDLCRFLNRRRLIPRPRIQCAADAPNPAAYLAKL